MELSLYFSLTVSEIFNGECDSVVDETTSKQGHSALAVVTCVLHRSFLERGQNMAIEALPPDLVSETVYLLSCELQTGYKIFNGECDAMIE